MFFKPVLLLLPPPPLLSLNSINQIRPAPRARVVGPQANKLSLFCQHHKENQSSTLQHVNIIENHLCIGRAPKPQSDFKRERETGGRRGHDYMSARWPDGGLRR